MFSVNFIFKNCSSALSFSFKAYKNADQLYKKGQSLAEERLLAEDDYGQMASIDMSTVSAISFGDIEKDLDRQGELSILQTKSQMRTQIAGKNDAHIRMLGTQLNGSQPTIVGGH